MSNDQRVTGVASLMLTTTTAGRDNHMTTPTVADFGGVIDLDAIVKGRRGAEAERNPLLLSLLTDALGAGKAAAITGLAVLRSDFDSDEAFRNERQKHAASIRSHAAMLIEDGVLPAGSKVSINWHPETGVPQVSLRK
jgi:hypothetical protein